MKQIYLSHIKGWAEGVPRMHSVHILELSPFFTHLISSCFTHHTCHTHTLFNLPLIHLCPPQDSLLSIWLFTMNGCVCVFICYKTWDCGSSWCVCISSFFTCEWVIDWVIDWVSETHTHTHKHISAVIHISVEMWSWKLIIWPAYGHTATVHMWAHIHTHTLFPLSAITTHDCCLMIAAHSSSAC